MDFKKGSTEGTENECKFCDWKDSSLSLNNPTSSKSSVPSSILKLNNIRISVNQNRQTQSFKDGSSTRRNSSSTKSDRSYAPKSQKSNPDGSRIYSVDFRKPVKNYSDKKSTKASSYKQSDDFGSGTSERSYGQSSSVKSSYENSESGCNDGDVECYKAHIKSLENRIKKLETTCGKDLPKSLAVLEHKGNCENQARYTLEVDMDAAPPRGSLQLSFCSADLPDSDKCRDDEGPFENAVDAEDIDDYGDLPDLIDEYSRFLSCARNAVKENESKKKEKEASDVESVNHRQGYECERQQGTATEKQMTQKEKFNRDIDTILVTMLYDKKETLKIMNFH